MTLDYETIFSRFRGKETDYELAAMDDEDALEFQIEWLHSAIGTPRMRRIFSTLSLNDDDMIVKFELKNKVDDDADMEFVLQLIPLGMKIAWFEPRVDSILNTSPTIGGKEEKKIIDNHRHNINRLRDMKVELQKMIRDYGYMYNSYVRGR